jgi:hypothetical protein
MNEAAGATGQGGRRARPGLRRAGAQEAQRVGRDAPRPRRRLGPAAHGRRRVRLAARRARPRHPRREARAEGDRRVQGDRDAGRPGARRRGRHGDRCARHDHRQQHQQPRRGDLRARRDGPRQGVAPPRAVPRRHGRVRGRRDSERPRVRRGERGRVEDRRVPRAGLGSDRREDPARRPRRRDPVRAHVRDGRRRGRDGAEAIAAVEGAGTNARIRLLSARCSPRR